MPERVALDQVIKIPNLRNEKPVVVTFTEPIGFFTTVVWHWDFTESAFVVHAEGSCHHCIDLNKLVLRYITTVVVDGKQQKLVMPPGLFREVRPHYLADPEHFIDKNFYIWSEGEALDTKFRVQER